jgi:hypothetical protein
MNASEEFSRRVVDELRNIGTERRQADPTLDRGTTAELAWNLGRLHGCPGANVFVNFGAYEPDGDRIVQLIVSLPADGAAEFVDGCYREGMAAGWTSGRSRPARAAQARGWSRRSTRYSAMADPRRLGPGRHPSARRRNVIAFLTPDGPTYLIVPNPDDRSTIARHLNAVRRYIETGISRDLKRFRGEGLAFADGTRLEFVTDLATIDRLAEGGELHYELYRR